MLPFLSPELEDAFANLKARQEGLDDRKNVGEICGHDIDDGIADVAKDIWRVTGADTTLDIIALGSYDNWVRNMDQAVFDKQQSDSWDCATLDGTCGHAADCLTGEFFTRDRPEYYWIMSSVSKAHTVLKTLHTELESSVLLQSLSLDQLKTDFGVENPKINPAGVANGAFASASGVFGMAGLRSADLATRAGPYGGALAVISGGFGIAASTYQSSDPGATMETMLADYFNQSRTAIADMARNLFGEGDQSKLPEAGQSGDRNYFQSPVGRTFNEGKFVIESVDAVWKDYINVGNKLLQQALGIRILSELGYLVFINVETTEELCVDEKKSNLWTDGLCVGLYHTPEYEHEFGNPNSYKISPLDNAVVDTMTGKYEFNLMDVYSNAIECKRARQDGEREVDIQNIPYGGDWPQCMFNIDVVKGKFKGGKWFDDFEAL
ncbi:uncharacterized protein J4E78_009608 [Alternaria triticimaculans]|uniref:uncharacterized protein n=1 Tax=Alternaria triticimaculans TaxID=297637 RepID=UPI0020C3F35E|nr:uncharacterized protein J4E78_009608 [Alternaria triticimaculans]KAI4644789.1 hypothetical protein J4E78_009608 [Alternaria triticimaculans]